MSNIVLKDNQFNRLFCEKWPLVRPFLVTWELVAKRFLVKKAINFLLTVGDKKHLECKDLPK